MSVIVVEDVWKNFTLHHQRTKSIKQAVVDAISPFRKNYGIDAFWALQGVNFTVSRGETLGIIGSNGSGKSTILKLVVGISKPNRGKVLVNGRVSALLELGAGFHPDFTGRENVFLNGAILGLSRKEIAKKFDDIVEFAEIAPFIDNPVRTYSSGMYMRLAFAIAIHVNPDILVIDEVLAVGDAAFQKKCLDQIQRFKQEGKTILFVSHDKNSVRQFCDRAIWLDRGRQMADGPATEVIEQYETHLLATAPTSPDEGAFPIQLQAGRFVSDSGILLSEEGTLLEFTYSNRDPRSRPSLQLRINRADGLCLFRGSPDPHTSLPPAGESARVRLHIERLNLLTGRYCCEIIAQDGVGETSLPIPFEVSSELPGEGVVPLRCQWEFLPLGTTTVR